MNETIKIAAEWWANKLRKRGSEWDNGDDGCNENTQSILSMFGGQDSFTDEQIEKFTENLTAAIGFKFKSDGRCEIHIDYHAPHILMDAAEGAGMEHVNGAADFGCKTNMWINSNYVEVSDGYGAENQKLYPEGEKA